MSKFKKPTQVVHPEAVKLRDGNRIEIYCSDYQTLDPDHEPIKWDLKDPQRQTLWGAAAPLSWFEHGTTFTGVETSESQLAATPIIAP